MAFALLYNDDDMLAMAQQLVRQDLPANLKTEAGKFWDGGFKNFHIAPGAPFVRTEGDPNTNVLEIQANGGLRGFVDLLRGIAAAFPGDPQAQYMSALADDIESPPFGDNSGAKEPWTGQ